MNGAIWVSATGRRWKDMPGRYGDAGACYSRYHLWKREGTLETIAMVLARDRQRAGRFGYGGTSMSDEVEQQSGWLGSSV